MNDKLDHFVLEYDHESGTALLAMTEPTADASPRAGPSVRRGPRLRCGCTHLGVYRALR